MFFWNTEKVYENNKKQAQAWGKRKPHPCPNEITFCLTRDVADSKERWQRKSSSKVIPLFFVCVFKTVSLIISVSSSQAWGQGGSGGGQDLTSEEHCNTILEMQSKKKKKKCFSVMLAYFVISWFKNDCIKSFYKYITCTFLNITQMSALRNT